MAAPIVSLSADAGSVVASRDGTVVAEGRLASGTRAWSLTAGPPAGGADLDVEATAAVLGRLVDITVRVGGGAVRWLVSAPTPEHDAAATSAGLTMRRDLLEQRRPLPVEAEHRAGLAPLATRTFRPGVDEEAWLEVNNRAFAEHPDQSAQTLADLRRQQAEPWFDPEGFLLLDAAADGPRAGYLDGFCWTKEHQGSPTDLGEIYVIGVDPTAHGRGLGPALTVAGLDHLHARGLGTGMLYVDRDNVGAVRMYDRLGFTTHHIDRIYTSDL